MDGEREVTALIVLSAPGGGVLVIVEIRCA
jgi:hypothetical protein